jgi:hypothetical protein
MLVGLPNPELCRTVRDIPICTIAIFLKTTPRNFSLATPQNLEASAAARLGSDVTSVFVTLDMPRSRRVLPQ